MNPSKLSRVMSHALRHAPSEYGIILDKHGWVAIDKLIGGIQNHLSVPPIINEEMIRTVCLNSKKQRFEIRENHIRATYGHSIDLAIEYEIAIPPEFLYHGTAPKTVPQIIDHGIQSMKRSYVHLSTNLDMAKKVGLRKSKTPRIIQVFASKAHNEGIQFYSPVPEMWLTLYIPPSFLKVYS